MARVIANNFKESAGRCSHICDVILPLGQAEHRLVAVLLLSIILNEHSRHKIIVFIVFYRVVLTVA